MSLIISRLPLLNTVKQFFFVIRVYFSDVTTHNFKQLQLHNEICHTISIYKACDMWSNYWYLLSTHLCSVLNRIFNLLSLWECSGGNVGITTIEVTRCRSCYWRRNMGFVSRYATYSRLTNESVQQSILRTPWRALNEHLLPIYLLKCGVLSCLGA